MKSTVAWQQTHSANPCMRKCRSNFNEKKWHFKVSRKITWTSLKEWQRLLLTWDPDELSSKPQAMKRFARDGMRFSKLTILVVGKKNSHSHLEHHLIIEPGKFSLAKKAVLLRTSNASEMVELWVLIESCRETNILMTILGAVQLAVYHQTLGQISRFWNFSRDVYIPVDEIYHCQWWITAER